LILDRQFEDQNRVRKRVALALGCGGLYEGLSQVVTSEIGQ